MSKQSTNSEVQETFAAINQMAQNALNELNPNFQINHPELQQFAQQYNTCYQKFQKMHTELMQEGSVIENKYKSQQFGENFEDEKKSYYDQVDRFVALANHLEQANHTLKVFGLVPEATNLKLMGAKSTDTKDSLQKIQRSFEVLANNFNASAQSNPGFTGPEGSIVEFAKTVRLANPNSGDVVISQITGIRTERKVLRTSLDQEIQKQSLEQYSKYLKPDLSVLDSSHLEYKASQQSNEQQILQENPNIALFKKELYNQFKDYLIIGYTIGANDEKVSLKTHAKTNTAKTVASVGIDFLPPLARTLASSLLNQGVQTLKELRQEKYKNFASKVIYQTGGPQEQDLDRIAQAGRLGLKLADEITYLCQHQLKSKDMDVKVLAKEVMMRINDKIDSIIPENISHEQFIKNTTQAITQERGMMITAPIQQFHTFGKKDFIVLDQGSQDQSQQLSRGAIKQIPAEGRTQESLPMYAMLNHIKDQSQGKLKRGKMEELLKQSVKSRLGTEFGWQFNVSAQDFTKMSQWYQDPEKYFTEKPKPDLLSDPKSRIYDFTRAKLAKIMKKLYTQEKLGQVLSATVEPMLKNEALLQEFKKVDAQAKEKIDDSRTIAAKMQKLFSFTKSSSSKVAPSAGYSKTHTANRDSLVR